MKQEIINGGNARYLGELERLTDVAFCRALLVTLTGSRIPDSTMSTYSSVAALKPVPGADSFTLLMITAPSRPAFASRRKRFTNWKANLQG